MRERYHRYRYTDIYVYGCNHFSGLSMTSNMKPCVDRLMGFRLTGLGVNSVLLPQESIIGIAILAGTMGSHKNRVGTLIYINN